MLKLELEGSKISYNYCGICGRRPDTGDEPNHTPLRWWDADDGWKIGTLCRWCWNEAKGDRPSPEDYAYELSEEYASDVNIDEDLY